MRFWMEEFTAGTYVIKESVSPAGERIGGREEHLTACLVGNRHVPGDVHRSLPPTGGENADSGLVIMSQKRNSGSYVLQTLPIKTSKFLKANDFLNLFKHIQHPLGSSV